MTVSDTDPVINSSPRELPTVAVVADEVGLHRVRSALAGSFSVQPCRTLEHVLEAEPAFELVVLTGDSELLTRGGPVETLRGQRPDCRIVIVSTGQGPAIIRKALRCGVDGFVLSDAVKHALAPAVSAVAAGYLSVPQAIRRPIDWSGFSVRERQVLQLVAEGLTNSEIGQRLFLSESTVKSHLSTGFRKLGVSSRAEAAAAVLQPEGAVGTPAGS